MDRNPCQGIRRNKENVRERNFTDDELARIGVALREIDPVYADAIRLLALTGWRASELLTAQIEDIDLQREVIIFRDSKTGRRASRLHERAVRLAKNLSGNRTGPLLNIGYWTLQKILKRVLDAAGVKNASSHTFRHTLATYMAQHGDSVTTIAAMGGWKTLAMVQRYVSLHGVGKPHPLDAHERIWRAIAP
jgi:integrase